MTQVEHRGGARPGSGPKPSRITQYRDWFDANPHKIIELLEVLYEMGVKGDREAAIYVINRIAGTPKQTIDQANININFSPDDYLRLQPLLNAGRHLITTTPIEIPAVVANDTTKADSAKLPESEGTKNVD